MFFKKKKTIGIYIISMIVFEGEKQVAEYEIIWSYFKTQSSKAMYVLI